MARNAGTTTLLRHQVKKHGVHAKTKTSKLKGSKHYVKPYRGQGR